MVEMKNSKIISRVLFTNNTSEMDWTPFLRQFVLSTGCWTVFFMEGLCMGIPTVMVPQLKRDDQTVGIEHTSWLVALIMYCSIPWVLVLSFLITKIGPKKSHIIVCTSTLIGFMIFYFSNNINHFFVGEIFQGVLIASQSTTNIAILTEYTSPKYRGVFLTIKGASACWGFLVANAVGTFYDWQYIALLGIICGLYTLVNVIIWPESPLWLATNDKFIESSAANIWLKGSDEETEKEFNILIKSQENRKLVKQIWGVRYLIHTIFRKQFLKPIFLSILLICLLCFSGKLVCMVYALDILTKISSNEWTAYLGMLILDSVTVVSMYIGCVVSRFLRRKVMLIFFSSISITAMFIISLYLFLVSLSVIQENNYFCLVLLAIYSLTTSCGPIILCTTIMGELLPLEARVLSMCVVALTYKIINGTFMKLSPLCFEKLGLHGTFLLYATLSLTIITLIYYYVPETKDKSLTDIDICLKGEETEKLEERC